ncbi:hypothetical protein ISCGN_031009 [Ixodes scapularis]
MSCRDVVWIWATATVFLVALFTGTFRYTADKGSNSDRPDRLPKEFPEHNSQLADSFQQANHQLAPLLSAHKRLSIRETKRTLDGALANYLNDHRCEEKVKEVNKKLCEIIPVSVHPCIVCDTETPMSQLPLFVCFSYALSFLSFGIGQKIPYDDQSKEIYAQMIKDAGKEADKLKDNLKKADEGKLDWHDIDDEIERADDLVSNLTKVANHLNNMVDQDPNDTVAKKHLDDAPRGETSAETRAHSNDLRRGAQTPRDTIALLPSARGAGPYEVDSAARKATGDNNLNLQAPDSVRLADHPATQVTDCSTRMTDRLPSDTLTSRPPR